MIMYYSSFSDAYAYSNVGSGSGRRILSDLERLSKAHGHE